MSFKQIGGNIKANIGQATVFIPQCKTVTTHDVANAGVPVGNGLVRSALRNRFPSGMSGG